MRIILAVFPTHRQPVEMRLSAYCFVRDSQLLFWIWAVNFQPADQSGAMLSKPALIEMSFPRLNFDSPAFIHMFNHMN
jgi:hypothetical protein